MDHTVVIILDKEAADFVAGQAESPNDYICRLLREEMRREKGLPASQPSAAELLESTPDTSGYPEMQGSWGE